MADLLDIAVSDERLTSTAAPTHRLVRWMPLRNRHPLVEEAKRYTDEFPLSKAGLLEWHFLAFDAPLPLEYLFDPSVDISKPWNRTVTT
jgi:hypothetical protein